MVPTKKAATTKKPLGPVVVQAASVLNKPAAKSHTAAAKSGMPAKGKAVPEKNQSASTSRTSKKTMDKPMKAAGNSPAASHKKVKPDLPEQSGTAKNAAKSSRAAGESVKVKAVKTDKDSPSGINVEISSQSKSSDTPKSRAADPESPSKKSVKSAAKSAKNSADSSSSPKKYRASSPAEPEPKKPIVKSAESIGPENAKINPNISNAVIEKTEVSESEDQTMLNQTGKVTSTSQNKAHSSVAASKKSKFKLKPADVDKLKAMLYEERERILEEMRILDERSLVLSDHETDQQPGFSQQLADSATENIQVETDLAIRSIEAEQLRQIDDALRAIEDGEYGKCQRCNLGIDFQRLKVRPNARYCISCLRLLEARKG